VTTKKNVVRVTIVGEEYTIRSDASAEHTEAVARYVDSAIRRIRSNAPPVEAHKVAILAALQITDELFRLREEADALASGMHALSNDVRRWLPPTKRGTPASVEALAPEAPTTEAVAWDDGGPHA
jgi:cell division protein ZapA